MSASASACACTYAWTSECSWIRARACACACACASAYAAFAADAHDVTRAGDTRYKAPRRSNDEATTKQRPTRAHALIPPMREHADMRPAITAQTNQQHAHNPHICNHAKHARMNSSHNQCATMRYAGGYARRYARRYTRRYARRY